METETIRILSNAESTVNGTSLITLYLPAGSNLWLAREHVEQERSTAPNIKNKNVGKAVANALSTISYKLKTMPELSSNGLAIYAGDYIVKRDNDSYQCL